ncbi:hypothetical protein J6590_020417 [Homalodisca vitripennis]|nr:hypothetical protein J6590_020417 [Homalodisca vitripennis]
MDDKRRRSASPLLSLEHNLSTAQLAGYFISGIESCSCSTEKSDFLSIASSVVQFL